MLKIIKYDYKRVIALPVVLIAAGILINVVLAILSASGRVNDNYEYRYISLSSYISTYSCSAIIFYSLIILSIKTFKNNNLYKLSRGNEIKIVFARMILLFAVVTVSALIFEAETTIVGKLFYENTDGIMLSKLNQLLFCNYKKPFLSWLYPLQKAFWTIWAYSVILAVIGNTNKIERRFYKLLINGVVFIGLDVLFETAIILITNWLSDLNFNILIFGNEMFLNSYSILPLMSAVFSSIQLDTLTYGNYDTIIINILSIGEVIYTLMFIAICLLCYSLNVPSISLIKKVNKKMQRLIESIIILIFFTSSVIFVSITATTPKLCKEIQSLSESSQNISAEVNEVIDLTDYVDIEKYIKVPRCTLNVDYGYNYSYVDERGRKRSTYREKENMTLSDDYKTLMIDTEGSYCLTINQINNFITEEYNVLYLRITVTSETEDI